MRCALGTGREAQHPQPFYFGIILRIMEIRLKMILRGAHQKRRKVISLACKALAATPRWETAGVWVCVWRLFLMFATHEEFISICGGDPTNIFSGKLVLELHCGCKQTLFFLLANRTMTTVCVTNELLICFWERRIVIFFKSVKPKERKINTYEVKLKLLAVNNEVQT